MEGGEGQDGLVDDWHFDSYPFVCITMLNDPQEMVGGETICQKANGELVPISFPTAGSAIVLQVPLLLHMLILKGDSSTTLHHCITLSLHIQAYGWLILPPIEVMQGSAICRVLHLCRAFMHSADRAFHMPCLSCIDDYVVALRHK